MARVILDFSTFHTHSLKNMPTIWYFSLNMSFRGHSSHFATSSMRLLENLFKRAYLPKPRLMQIQRWKFTHFSFLQ
jgi:hypothetical protein